LTHDLSDAADIRYLCMVFVLSWPAMNSESSHQYLMGLASQSGCVAYDCKFVTLAKGLRVPLVTMDRQVLWVAVSSTEFVG
jgi:predicted nucleic acid-binding protein